MTRALLREASQDDRKLPANSREPLRVVFEVSGDQPASALTLDAAEPRREFQPISTRLAKEFVLQSMFRPSRVSRGPWRAL
jgi:hypothetical protein